MIRRWAGVALGALLASGCFRTVVRSGHPPGRTPDRYDERWHSGFAAGLIEDSGPHWVDEVCPEGWAEVRTETDPLHTFLNLVTWFIYSPQSVSLVCAEQGAPAAPPRQGYGVPPVTAPSGGFPPPAPPADF